MLANCATCHKPAGKNIGSLVAPMSLMTYEETRPWARAIARKVKAREMPPWFADAPKGVFTNERGLTPQQIDTIVKWFDAFAAKCDAKDMPAPKQWPVAPFVEETGTFRAFSSPKACLMTRVSLASPSGVEVACAFT